MADTNFKNAPITFVEGWTKHSNGEVIGDDQYRPDRSFENDKGDVICVIESSSTNDRKVGVGELCLADKFFTDSKVAGVLIFSLCSQSKYPPTSASQAEYLKPCFQHLKKIASSYGVQCVYLIEEEVFESLNWVALDDAFIENSTLLRAQG